MDKTPDVARLSVCCGKRLVWNSTANEGGEVDGWGGRCPGCGTEWAELATPARRLLSTEQMLLARIAELEATLTNERGEGEPPVPGWEWDADEGEWLHGNVGSQIVVSRTAKGWTWDADRVSSGCPHFNTARDAMRAASGAADAR